MSTRTLGILALIGAPFLMIDTIHNGFQLNAHSSLSGVFNLIYITAWMCSILALRRLGALGTDRTGKLVFILQMTFLSLADCWNLYELLQPGAGTRLYYMLDAFWPISNLCMLFTGLTIALKGKLKGWRRYTPLVAGTWLPFGLILWAIFSRTPGMLLTINMYSALAWSWMAVGIITDRETEKGRNESSRREGRQWLATIG